LRRGRAASAVLNAANEVAVQAFLEGRLRFTGIAATIERVLAAYDPDAPAAIDEVLEIDRRAREVAVGMLPN
jgi:1-deoxy-D-xylulose-5-phosphate reductoisomerase